MPELPEVETIRRGLEPVLSGARICRLQVRRPDLRFPFPDRFAERVEGQRIERLMRRAKYLVAELSSGEALVMHLGMTGRFSVVTKSQEHLIGAYVYETDGNPQHDHVAIELTSGVSVVYNDPRRFGFMVMMDWATRETHALFRKMGIEPLGPELTPEYLAARARGRKSNLKAFLMDQRNVAGLGNIYVSEALHRAGIAPNRAARFLSDARGRPTDRARALVPAITSVLEQAIAAGGSTLKDYRHADGERGAFQESFAVYDRDGAPCVRPGCDGVIRRTIDSGRATYACTRCQR